MTKDNMQKSLRTAKVSEFPEDVTDSDPSDDTPDRIPDSSESMGHQNMLTFDALKREQAEKYQKSVKGIYLTYI